jgi:hypothetical protein
MKCLNLQNVRKYALKIRHIPENLNLNQTPWRSILCEDKCVYLLHVFGVIGSVRNRAGYPIEICHYLFYTFCLSFHFDLLFISPRLGISKTLHSHNALRNEIHVVRCALVKK